MGIARARKNAVEKSKKILDETNFLIHYNPEKPLLLAYDASPYGLGAVLSHRIPDGSEKPITFTSGILSKAEPSYSQTEKEALAIVYAIKKFQQYLLGIHFLFTDHKLLLGLLSEQKGISSMAAARIQLWAILLSAYNYSLKYRRSSENSNADFFSRFPSNEKDVSS